MKGTPGLASQNQDLLNVQWPTYSKDKNLIYLFNITNSAVIDNEDTERCDWVAKNAKFDYQVHGPGENFVPS